MTVYWFVTEGSVEEVIVKRAAKKLRMDHLIMQKQNQNKLSDWELWDAIHCGAQEIILNSDENVIEQTIDELLQKG